MSTKILALPNSDYKIKVQSSGNITLDTGLALGTVTITGDLIVNGNTTQVSSSNLNLKDNIITLNEGEQGTGITLTQSGIQLDRGSLPDAKLVFDETAY